MHRDDSAWGSSRTGRADGAGNDFDNLEDKNEVIAIDSRTLEIKSRWPVAPAGPTGPSLWTAHTGGSSFRGRNPKLLVAMDADSGKIIGPEFPIGDRVDTNVFDPGAGVVAASTGEGAIKSFTKIRRINSALWTP